MTTRIEPSMELFSANGRHGRAVPPSSVFLAVGQYVVPGQARHDEQRGMFGRSR